MFLTAVDLSSDNVNREIVQLETTMGPHRSHRSILGKTIGPLTMPLEKGSICIHL